MRTGRAFCMIAGLLAGSFAVPSGAGAYFDTTPAPVPVWAPRIPEAVSGGYPFPPVLRTSFGVTAPEVPPVPEKKKAAPVLPGLVQVGAASSVPGGDYTRPVRGFGHRERIRDVLAQLLGAGWTVRYRGVAPGTEIDWAGGRTLPRTLDRIARTYGLGVQVDWNSRTILLSRPGVGKTGSVEKTPFRTKTEGP